MKISYVPADDTIEAALPTLSEMMSRRHQIVHQADIPAWGTKPAPIAVEDLEKWLKAVTDIALTVTAARLTETLYLKSEQALYPV